MDMLNSCGHALSQEAGSDFHPRCNWEATPPGYSASVRAWRGLAPCHGDTPANLLWQPSQAGRIGSAGRCNLLWEESEMGLQGKSGTGI